MRRGALVHFRDMGLVRCLDNAAFHVVDGHGVDKLGWIGALEKLCGERRRNVPPMRSDNRDRGRR